MPEALAQLAAELSEREDLEVSFETIDTELQLPHRLEAGLFRIAQEALANVVCRSGAVQVDTKLAFSPRHAQLSIEDDGGGRLGWGAPL